MIGFPKRFQKKSIGLDISIAAKNPRSLISQVPSVLFFYQMKQEDRQSHHGKIFGD